MSGAFQSEPLEARSEHLGPAISAPAEAWVVEGDKACQLPDQKDEAGTQKSEARYEEPKFVGFEWDREVRADGFKYKLYYLTDSGGNRHLAVTGKESDAKDCHYHYCLEPPFSHQGGGPWGNACAVQEWLGAIISGQAEGQTLGLGQSLMDAAGGATTEAGQAAPMEWQPPPSASKTDGSSEQIEALEGPKSEECPLDTWPPLPPPARSQLPLAPLPPFSLPQPPPPVVPQTVAEVQTEAAQARSSAVAALVARAERLHALRSSAVSAALDWLRGDLPADEVQLLRSNISGVTDTLAEIDCLPPLPPEDVPPCVLPPSISQHPSAGLHEAALASVAPSQSSQMRAAAQIAASQPAVASDSAAQNLVEQTGSVDAPGALGTTATRALQQLEQPSQGGANATRPASTVLLDAETTAAAVSMVALPLDPWTEAPAGEVTAAQAGNQIVGSEESKGESRTGAGRTMAVTARQAEVARRAKLVTEALDYLREITSTFMPLPVQAAVGAVASIAAASKHQNEAVALLAQESLWTLRRIAQVHLATLASAEMTEDPRTALAARLPTIAAAADAVTKRDVAVASATARTAAARAMQLAEAGQSVSAALLVDGGSDGIGNLFDNGRLESSAAVGMPPLFGDDQVLQDTEELVKPATKPRTPHARFMQAKCTAKAAAAAATAAAAARTLSAAPPAASIPPAAIMAPAASTSVPPLAVSSHVHPQQPAADGPACTQPMAAAAQGSEIRDEGLIAAVNSSSKQPAIEPGGIGEAVAETPARGASDSDSEMEMDWPASVDVDEPFHIDDDPNAGPIGNAVKVLRQGKGRLQAARFCEVNSVARGVVTAALQRLECADQWTQDSSFRKSIEDKAAQLRRDAGRLSREKAPSTNRKARACVLKGAEFLLKAVEAYAA